MNVQSSMETESNQANVIKYGIRLGVKASAIGNILFFAFLLLCALIYQNPAEELDTFERAVEFLFLGIILILGFVGALLPGMVGGGTVAIALRTMSRSNRLPVGLGIIIGLVVGGFIGYFWLYCIGLLSSYTEFAKDPVCGLLNGAIAGSIAGAWHGGHMNRWITVS